MPTPIKSMNPSCFDFSTYCGTVGVNIFELFKDGGLNTFPPVINPKWTILGYCKAESLKVRPKDEGFAIMVETDEDDDILRCWFHLSNTEFNLLFTPQK